MKMRIMTLSSKLMTKGNLSFLHDILSLPVGRSKSASAVKFFLFSILLHLLLFSAIFDIYFTSPVITNINVYHRPLFKDPPARRLVLIVSDGLRADRLFDKNLQHAPFLRDVVNRRGGWGISHTRVPTESRPGHNAIIAGIYEDVASVTKGWKENPVEFDSLFNRSTATWSWGDHDVNLMFVKGAVPGRVNYLGDPTEMLDFGYHDKTELDISVVAKVSDFLKNSSKIPSRKLQLSNSGTVFFLHLPGADLAGHSDKPQSKEYSKSITVADECIKKIERLFEEFFNHDHRTAYVFTADHGMTNWGSHGAGSEHETMTPLVTWGAGFRGPLKVADPTKTSWSIPSLRWDVEQADLCPLMSAVIGTSFPVNSVGRLPLRLLNMTIPNQMEVMRANAFQLLEQFFRKRLAVKKVSLSAFFTEFHPLTPSIIESQQREAVRLARSGRFADATEIYQMLANNSIDGLYYYHRYDRVFSGLCVTMIFLSWIACLFISIIPNHIPGGMLNSEALFSKIEIVFFSSLILFQVIVLLAESRPILQWLYRLVPIYMLWSLFRHRPAFRVTTFPLREALEGIAIIIGLELLVWTFFYRYLLSIAVILHCVWQSATVNFNNRTKYPMLIFLCGSLALSIFPLFPVIGQTMNLATVPIGSSATCIIVLCFLLSKRKDRSCSTRSILFLFMQVIISISACFSHHSCHVSLGDGYGLNKWLQKINWFILLVSFLTIFDVARMLNDDLRLMHIWISITTIFTLLSVFYETIFLFTLYITINAWIVAQIQSNDSETEDVDSLLTPFLPPKLSSKRVPLKSSTDTSVSFVNRHVLRVCFSYMTFITLSFFGTGNIASINSFDPKSVYCFLTVFKPFLMGALLLLKIALPMLLISCLFLVLMSDVQITLVSRVAMILADFMALHFFFLIRDSGSWLDIGTSISHYVISMALTVIVFVFLSLSRVLLKQKLIN